jgi:hypothetical protein
VKRFIFYAMDQYTIKVLCRKEWEAGVKHGIKCEQQRIIKLLEDYEWTEIFIPTLIALIKGENK